MTKRERYDKYEDYLKLDAKSRDAFEDGVAAIVNVLKAAGIACRNGAKPMSDVSKIVLNFRKDGDFTLGDVDITGDTLGCYLVLCMEPRPPEKNERFVR